MLCVSLVPRPGAGVEVYTVPGVQVHFQSAFDVPLLTARELSSHFAESCKY